MRYQNYKAKMMKIRKVLDVIYRLRFVIAGVTSAAIAAAVTLDLVKGNITSVSEFEVSYKYGEGISYSGEAFMGNVTFEFRKKGTEEWTTETPKYVGEYETRAVSQGNHGLKYSDISEFTITPIEVELSVKGDHVNFGDDSPDLTYSLLSGDRLAEGYTVTYDDLTKETTNVSINLDTIKFYDSNDVDVTNCYTIKTEPKEIAFNKQPLTITFEDYSYSYTGDTYPLESDNEYTFDGTLFYGARIQVDGGISVTEPSSTAYPNNHSIRIIDDEGNDYTNNYQISLNDNSITINKAEAFSISSHSLEKVYSGETFPDESFVCDVEGLLPIHHAEVQFEKKDRWKACNEKNTFTYQILDSENKPIDISKYYKTPNITYGNFIISKKEINLTSETVDAFFDNTEKGTTQYLPITPELGKDDHIEVTGNTFVAPGHHDNVLTYTVLHKTVVDDVASYEDVTNSCYVLNTTNGKINIEIKPLVFKFKGQEITYDGLEHSVYDPEEVTLSEETVANLDTEHGWKFEASVPTYKMKNAGKYNGEGQDANVEYKIYAPGTDGDIDVTDYYKSVPGSVTFNFGESEVKKKETTVSIGDLTFGSGIFDNKTFEQKWNEYAGELFSATDLLAEDHLVVEYKNSSDKNIKNYQEEAHRISFIYKIKHISNGLDVSSNYDIKYTHDTIDMSIAKRTIIIDPIDYHIDANSNVHCSKIYDGTNNFNPETPAFSSLPIEGEDPNASQLSVKLKTKNYQLSTSNVSDPDLATYELGEDDLDIYIGTEKVTDNYAIISGSGTFKIEKRDVVVSQITDNDKYEYIVYDGQEHGVMTDSSDLSVHEQQNANDNTGLVQNHSISFNNSHTITEKGTLNLDGSVDGDFNTLFDPLIIDTTNSEDVTNNYNIIYYTDNIGFEKFRFNVIKQIISIRSPSGEKDFDGEKFDLYPSPVAEFDTYYPHKPNDSADFTSKYSVHYYYVYEDEYSFTHQIQVSGLYNPNHQVQLTKTRESVVNSAIEWQSDGYDNEFDYQVVDKSHNNALVTNFYDFRDEDDIYNTSVFCHYGKLTINKVYVTVACLTDNKIYDGVGFATPELEQPMDIDNDANAKKWLSITHDDRGTICKSNFRIKAKFKNRSLDDLFYANTYNFETYDFIKEYNNGDAYNGPSLVVSKKTGYEKYVFTVVPKAITVVGRGIYNSNHDMVKDLRYIQSGELYSGDTLTFNGEKIDVLKTSYLSECLLENIVIYRNFEDEVNRFPVTTCYNINVIRLYN